MKTHYIKVLTTIILTVSSLITLPVPRADAEEKPLAERSPSERGVIRAVGVSEANQDRYKAITAAKVIAQSNLLGMIQSTYIDRIVQSKGDDILDKTIRARVQGVIAGAFSCGATYHEDQGYAEVCLEVKLNGKGGLYEALYSPTSKNTGAPQESARGQ